MHEKEKKEVFSSANYVFALKPHLLNQMEYIFSALRMLLCLLRQLPLNVTALAKVYIFCFSNEFSGQKRPKNGFCRFAILAYDKSTRSHE